MKFKKKQRIETAGIQQINRLNCSITSLLLFFSLSLYIGLLLMLMLLLFSLNISHVYIECMHIQWNVEWSFCFTSLFFVCFCIVNCNFFFVELSCVLFQTLSREMNEPHIKYDIISYDTVVFFLLLYFSFFLFPMFNCNLIEYAQYYNN